MDRALEIGIVGCGFAGAAAAIFFGRNGHRVNVFERAARPSAVGAGILLQPTGLAVLDELGLLPALLARGARVRNLIARSVRGRTLFDLHYARLLEGLFGMGMHRGALFEVLLTALETSGATLHAGTEVQALKALPERTAVIGADGAALGDFDLVLVADGARSRLREARDTARARPYPFGALWFVGEDPEARFAGTLSQLCDGTERMLGFLPTGLGPKKGRTPLVSLFWSQRMDRVEAVRRNGLAAWKEIILRYEPRADTLLAQIQDLDQLLVASYMDVVMHRFHHDRVVYVGDAAHATSPQLGQGTNLALLDARALSSAIEHEPNLERALPRYFHARRAHTRFYGVASRLLTPFFQSNGRWLGTLRDALLPEFTRIPFVEREMLCVLSGVKRGVLRADLELPAPQPELLLSSGE